MKKTSLDRPESEAAPAAAPDATRPQSLPLPGAQPLALQQGDFYWEGGRMVLTAAYHLRRGYCCGSGCRHCPYPQGTQ
jgi:hypothetical protein